MAYPNFEKEIDETRRRVLDYLKPFQRETVLHVDRLFSRGIRRVLVADEVGLGKTLVARGVVATTAALRIAEGDDLFKVAYVLQRLHRQPKSREALSERKPCRSGKRDRIAP